MRRRLPAPLAILLAVATIQFLAWMLVLPAVQLPDEHTHFAYTQRLMETGHRPPGSGSGPKYSPELEAAWTDAGLKPLIGNLSARPYWTHLDEDLWRADDARLGPDARDYRTGPNGASNNPPLYYAYAGIAYAAEWNGSFFDRLYAMRLANLPLYLITIVMTWILAGQLFGRGALWPRTIAAGAVAVQPMFASVVVGISPDPFLTAIWALFLPLAVHTVRRGLTWRTGLGLAALAAASVATHPRGAPLAILAVLTAALALRRRVGPRVLAAAAAAGLALLAVALIQGADLLGTTEGAGFNARQFLSYVWQFYLPRLPFMTDQIGPDYGVQQVFVDTFYGVFASLEVRWPEWVYHVLAAASAAGLIWLAAVLVRARARIAAQWDVAVVLAAAPLLLIAALHFAAYRNLRIEPDNPVIVGRYLFPVLPLFGVAIALVVRSLPLKPSAAAGSALLFTGALLGLSGLGMSVVRFYV